jgi:hypothetical protein
VPTLQIKKRKNNQRKRGNTRIFFESLEERLPVSASILGAVAGSLFLSESRQESQSVSSVVSAETASEIISHVNSAEGTLQESSNTFTTEKLKSFVAKNLFSTDFLLGEDTVSEDELSTVARSSVANHSSNDSVTTAILENDFNSVWSFLSEDDPNKLTHQFADDLLLQQTSKANQSTLTSERPLHFSALPPLPIEAVAAPIYAGIATASGGGGISTTSDVPEASQSVASSQTILVGDFSQLSQTSSSSSSTYGNVWFSYAALSDEDGYNGAHTNYNTNPNTTPTVQVDTAYVFQTGNTATVMTEIWGAPVWEYVPYSIEILDPGTYWGNNISVSGPEFYLPDSNYITDYFTWTKPSGLENNDPDIDRDFTFRFTVAGMYVDLDVHIAWAEYTLYVDPPVPNQSTIVANGDDVGHTFFRIDVDPYLSGLDIISEDTSPYIGIPWGFYPTGENTSSSGSYVAGYTQYECDGEVRNDSSHGWYVSKTYNINSLSKLNSSLNAIHENIDSSNTTPRYNINSNNCTSFALGIGELATGESGIFPAASASGWVSYNPAGIIPTVSFLFNGNCPGVLGYNLTQESYAVINPDYVGGSGSSSKGKFG